MRKAAVAWLSVLLLLLTGCWDMTEIEDTIYVASIGVDRDGEEYIWSFRLVEAGQLVVGTLTAAQGKPGRLASGIVSVRAQSLEQAVHLVQPGLARIVSLEHVRWIGISATLAKEGLAPLISQLLRNNQMRRGAGLYVFRGSAVDGFLHNRPVADNNAIKFFEGVRLVQKRFRLSPPLQLQHFYSRLMAPGLDPMLSVVAVNQEAEQQIGGEMPPDKESYIAGDIPRQGGNPVEFVGTAVFRGDRLKGLLTVNQTEAVLAMRGELGKVYATMPDPHAAGKAPLTFRLHQENKPQYRARFVGSRPTVHVKLQIEAEILSIPGQTDYSQSEHRRDLERHVANFLEEDALRPTLALVYHEWGTDPVGFGQLFRTHFPTHDAWLAYNWTEHIKDLAVTVEVDVFIRRFGMLFGNPKVD